MSKKLILALEELENEPTSNEEVETAELNEETQTEVSEPEEVQTEVPELEQQQEEIEEGNDFIDEVGSDVETLDSFQDTMEDSIESGEGLSEVAVETIRISVESIYRRLGIQKPETTSIAVENFKDPANRLAATKLALEEVEQQKDSLLQKIQKAIKWIIDKLVEFFKTVTDEVYRLEKNIKDLTDFVKSKKDGDLTDKEMDKSKASKIFKAFSATGDAVSYANVETQTQTVGELIKFSDFVINTIDKMKFQDRLLIGIDNLNEMRKVTDDAEKMLRDLSKSDFAKPIGSRLTFINGLKVKVEFTGEEVYGIGTMFSQRAQMKIISPEGGYLKDAEPKVEIMNKDQILTTLKKAEVIVSGLKSFQKESDKPLSSLNDFMKENKSRKIVKRESPFGEIKTDVSANIRNFLDIMIKITTTFTTVPSKLAIMTVKADLYYAQASAQSLEA